MKVFTATIERIDSSLYRRHIVIPKKIGNLFISGDNRRVVCTLNGMLQFQAALMHLGDGNYMIMINQASFKKLKVNDGDKVSVKLEKDESEYGLPVPEEFKELLKQDLSGSELFHALTAGKQRTLLYIIAKPQAADLRIRNGIAVLEHLKRNQGKINYKQLNDDIRNAF